MTRRAGTRFGRGAVGALALLLWAAGGDRLEAQEPDAALDSLEAAVDSGRVEGVRETLDRWLSLHGDSAGDRQLARARYLRGRVARDMEVARTEYLLAAMEGGSDYAPRARLRLAQLRLARGQLRRARQDLRLLRADFPSHELVPDSWLWTGRIHRSRGETEQACRAFARVVETAGGAGDSELQEKARRALAACRGGEGDDVRGTGQDAEEAGEGRPFTVQVGAFGEASAAGRLRDRARAVGFDARVVGPSPVDGLFRVRVGRFEGRPEAVELVERLEQEGFSALVTEAIPADEVEP